MVQAALVDGPASDAAAAAAAPGAAAAAPRRARSSGLLGALRSGARFVGGLPMWLLGRAGSASVSLLVNLPSVSTRRRWRRGRGA